MTDKDLSGSLTASEVAELGRVLSTERFSSYLLAARGDASQAIQLHAWNTMVSGAFYGPLQMVEIALRNAVHDYVSAVHGRQWLGDRQVLQGNELRRVDEARAQVRGKRKNPTADRVVAELSFGFWLSLSARRYDGLWNAVLNRAFVPTPPRRDLYARLAQLRDLRNRIAHHEPIHHLTLGDHYEAALWVLERISPVAAVWVSRHSRVPTILGDPERSPERF